MTVRLWHIPAMIALVALLHFGAVWSGFYDWQFSTRIIWFDNVLHALVGAGFAMGALFMLERSGMPLGRAQTVGFALFMVLALALFWELAEYIFYTRFTEYAYWSRIYSPTLSEALSDVASDIIGAGALLTALWRRM
ncbi:MAG: hypothetical protein AAB964_01165 [Patescibacteria group bacterium]